MEVNYFDIIVGGVILLLGLKGAFNGFFKEAFGLIGIIGGIFIASRLGDPVGQFLNQLLFNFENNSAIAFSGFLIVLAVFWSMMIGIGITFKQLTELSGLRPIEKSLGFVLGASKFFFIAAVIAHAAYSIQAVKTILDETSLKTSLLVPVLTEAGSYIMKLDPIEMTEEINNKAQSLQDQANGMIKQSTKDLAEETIDELKKSMPEMDK